MVGLCRFVGSALLALATLAWFMQEPVMAAAGAAVALVWLLAGQIAVFAEQRERARDSH